MERLHYSERVELLLEHWDCLIDELIAVATALPPDQVKPYNDILNGLIASREATRRGLLELDELEPFSLTSSEESHGQDREMEESQNAEKNVMEKHFFRTDVMKSPRQRYGREG